MFKAVFIRHGQSVYNEKGLFTGWIDCGLSRKGRKQAKRAGRALKKSGFIFDIAFCSALKRAKQTLDIVLKEMRLQGVEIAYSSALNERHYGALQGVNKGAAVKKYGFDRVFQWRRSFRIKPPVDENGKAESLEDTQSRVLPYWQNEIAPLMQQGRKIIISVHGSTLRALIKYFDNISDRDIENVNVPCALPFVYEFDENLKSQKRYYLASEKQVARALQKVVNETRLPRKNNFAKIQTQIKKLSA